MHRTQVVGVLALVGSVVPVGPTDRAPLPFGVGERLTYRVRASGVRGHGVMSVEGPVEVRGTETYHLQFTVDAGIGPLKGVERTESWLDPNRMAALRFHMYERRFLSKHEERVELYPEERRWETDVGRSGESPTDAPLDELSFIYFLRSLPLEPGGSYELNRYFDAERNPTHVRVLSRDVVATDAGMFHTVLVEMRVKDPRHYAGEGILRLQLSDDACRIPVRIESRAPDVGVVVLTLQSYVHPFGQCSSEES